MASSLYSKAPNHTRSVSLPCRSHPVVAQFDEDLSRLRSSQAASTSYSAISQKLGSLQNLYNHVDELLLLPLNQKNLSHSHQTKRVDVVLDGSLRLLDFCGIARDALLQTKESLQDISSVLRRRFSGELSVTNEIVEYMNTRKNVKKTIKSCLKNMMMSDKNGENDAIVRMMSDLEAVTSDIFKSLFYHIAGSKTQASKINWFVKLVQQSSDKKEAESTSGFESLDEALTSLVFQKKKTGFNMMLAENLRSDIMKLESEIQDLDEALDSLFRHLVKTRATLLNVLSN